MNCPALVKKKQKKKTLCTQYWAERRFYQHLRACREPVCFGVEKLRPLEAEWHCVSSVGGDCMVTRLTKTKTAISECQTSGWCSGSRAAQSQAEEMKHIVSHSTPPWCDFHTSALSGSVAISWQMMMTVEASANVLCGSVTTDSALL